MSRRRRHLITLSTHATTFSGRVLDVSHKTYFQCTPHPSHHHPMKDVPAQWNNHVSEAKCPLVVMSSPTPLKLLNIGPAVILLSGQYWSDKKWSAFIRVPLFLFFLIAKSMNINMVMRVRWKQEDSKRRRKNIKAVRAGLLHFASGKNAQSALLFFNSSLPAHSTRGTSAGMKEKGTTAIYFHFLWVFFFFFKS